MVIDLAFLAFRTMGARRGASGRETANLMKTLRPSLPRTQQFNILPTLFLTGLVVERGHFWVYFFVLFRRFVPCFNCCRGKRTCPDLGKGLASSACEVHDIVILKIWPPLSHCRALVSGLPNLTKHFNIFNPDVVLHWPGGGLAFAR